MVCSVSGWHKALNAAVRSKTPFYNLIADLHKESVFVSVQVRLVTQQKLCRRQKRRYRELQGRTFTAWRNYSTGAWSLMRMVRAFAEMYRPVE